MDISLSRGYSSLYEKQIYLEFEAQTGINEAENIYV